MIDKSPHYPDREAANDETFVEVVETITTLDATKISKAFFEAAGPASFITKGKARAMIRAFVAIAGQPMLNE